MARKTFTISEAEARGIMKRSRVLDWDPEEPRDDRTAGELWAEICAREGVNIETLENAGDRYTFSAEPLQPPANPLAEPEAIAETIMAAPGEAESADDVAALSADLAAATEPAAAPAVTSKRRRAFDILPEELAALQRGTREENVALFLSIATREGVAPKTIRHEGPAPTHWSGEAIEL